MADAVLSDIETIAKNSGRWHKYKRGVMMLCPCHADKNPSCAVWTSDDGNLIFCKCFAGCDWKDVTDTLRSKGFTLSAREQAGYAKRDLSQVVRAKRPTTDHDSLVRTMLARDIWDEGRSASGSPVSDYLCKRGLDLCVVPDPDRTIRFHPHCPRGKSRQAAMLCAMRDLSTDQVIAIHRTYLTKDGCKDGSPMMLGPSHQTAIKLTPHSLMYANGRTFAPLLHTCEGCETGIAALMLQYSPVWALGNAGAIARFEPQLAIGELVVLADHDAMQVNNRGLLWSPGITAAEACVRAWRMAGWRARYEMPEAEGEDYADVVSGFCALPSHLRSH